MSPHSLVADLVSTFKAQGRIVIVGASLAGLRAAEALRDEGFTGPFTLIGYRVHETYDRWLLYNTDGADAILRVDLCAPGITITSSRMMKRPVATR